MRAWGHPSCRHDAHNCLMWHKPNNSVISNSCLYNVCSECKAVYNELNAIKRRYESFSPGKHEKWTDLSSNRQYTYFPRFLITVRTGRVE